MASVIRSNMKESAESGSASHDSMAANVQSYLIASYRDALKKGDKSAAKSCLLAARYCSVNDPNVTNEIYIMAKSDGDVSEASKCFANIFNDLFISSPDSPAATSSELLAVKNQMKEETRILLGELKSQFLKLKSLPAPAALASRQAPSVQPSPMLSPRMRMSSEDRVASRESISKLDGYLHSSGRSFFYQQLFDNMSEDTKKSILDHSIETCDNPFEQIRLMMLTISIFNDSVATYGSRLLRTLIGHSDLSKKTPDTGKQTFANPRSSIMSHYAKSLLVLDAIPLVLKIAPLSSSDIDIEELFELTLNFYSEHCLETSATEYEPSELHEGVKKSIAARILGIAHNSASEEATEENLVATLNLLSQRFIETIADVAVKSKFEQMRSVVSDEKDKGLKFDRLLETIHELGLTEDISDDALFAPSKDETVQPTITPPPKGRGRPKKASQQSVIVSLDDGVKRHLQNKSREARFVFFSVLQHMFVKSASYLKSTRSRVLMNFDNPLATSIESEQSKTASQRTSRSKSGNHQNDTSTSPAKKIKLDAELDRTSPCLDESPLNSEQSKMMDLSILTTLIELHKCLEFLNSDYGVFTKLWQKFLVSNRTSKLQWYRRLSVDNMLMSSQYDKVPGLLETNAETQIVDDDDALKVESDLVISSLASIPGSPPVDVSNLRALVQVISCHVQKIDRIQAFNKIDELISRLKQCGLLTNDESYTSGNTMDEYMVTIRHNELNNLGFLFFDALSMVRYCVNVLMKVLKRYTISPSVISDTALGHAIVLSQFDWPKESRTYDQCIYWLRVLKPKSTTPQSSSAATKFTYPDFFQYIRNPNIIEDFMAMLCQGYTLDIKGNDTINYLSTSSSRAGGQSQCSSSGSRSSATTNSSSRSGKAITTRGVNKTFKEDLKVAILAQMRNSSVLMSLDMISEFIQTTLVPYLTRI